MTLKKRLRQWLLPRVIYYLYRALHCSWRVSFDECDSFRAALKEQRPVILAHWHGDELAVIHLVPRYRIATMTSTSKDGELMDEVLRRLGAATARGSSSKGGANAMRGLIRLCRKGGHNISFAVDGPRGPIYRVKPGVFEFSRLMQAPIYVVSVGASRYWTFHKAWNKSVLPKPFARIHVRVAEGLPALDRQTDAHDPALASRLEELLMAGRAPVAEALSR